MAMAHSPVRDPIPATRDVTPADRESPSPGVASAEARKGSSWVWWGMLVAIVVIIGTAIFGAAQRNDDRGIRGPADQGGVDTPREEKVPPSSPAAQP